MIDYKNEFPLPFLELPRKLQALLTVGNIDLSSEQIDVSTHFSHNFYQDDYEYLRMLMVCVPEDQVNELKILDVSGSDAVVKYSTPCCDEKGGLYPISLTASGYDYIVAAWGDGSNYSFSLAEKVWMTLGLSPRVLGNEEQKIIYDDLSRPVLQVAQGNVATEHYFDLKKSVYWTIRNDYLRRYLWMVGCYGVKSFFYEAYIEESDAVISLLADKDFYNAQIGNGWCDVCIRRNDERLLLQVHASVIAIAPELCVEPDINMLTWPSDSQPLSHQEATNFMNEKYVYVKDIFLERYEGNSLFEAIPFKMHEKYSSCPSYKGQWSFRNCFRIGRNMFRLSLYELYRGIPVQEIYHVHKYAISEHEAKSIGLTGEHIVEKVDKLLVELIYLGENFSKLLTVTISKFVSPVNFVEVDRKKYEDEGFREFSIFLRLARVAPLNMSEAEFLSRCKTLNEIINRIKPGLLKEILVALGTTGKSLQGLKTLKLLQAILNIIQYLNAQYEGIGALPYDCNHIDIKASNPDLSSFFINNDLRNAESHEMVEECLFHLERGGFDIASVSDGYGKALDFIFDSIINSFSLINNNLNVLLSRV